MPFSLRGQLLGLAALGAAGVAAPSAWAGCAQTATYQPSDWTAGSEARPVLQHANFGAQGIVGLWSISLMSGGNQVDWGYSEWHSDGTEIMNSGGHTPASGNFCLGVWRQTSPNSYHLKHFPLGYNPATGLLAAKIILTEDVTVDRAGDDFAGTFTEDIYDPTGATLLQHVAGTITGRRVEPN